MILEPLSEPIEWLPDGTPYSPRFGDRYHSEDSHGLAQARFCFLAGCGLPAAWAGQSCWRILETGFGLGLNFLVTWAAWRADPQRPQVLHFTSVEAFPAGADDILRAALRIPQATELHALAQQLAVRFHGLLPGVHRLGFENGRVMLTLWIGDAQSQLRQQTTIADSIYLDGFSPSVNPDIWNLHTIKALARHCRQGTQLATWSVARSVREHLAQCGFDVGKVPGVPPKRHNLHAVFNPAWQRRERVSAHIPMHPTPVGRAIVIGAGLAGSAVAYSLALRGWQVTVLAVGHTPADAASGLPVGLFGTQVSPDDNILARLTRCGARLTLQRLRDLHPLCEAGSDWGHSGVLEHCTAGDANFPHGWLHSAGAYWSTPASAAQLAQAGLPAHTPARWHSQAGWVRPARLVQAQLQHPNIRFVGSATVAQLRAPAHPLAVGTACWQAVDADGQLLAAGDIAIIAAGAATPGLLPPDICWPLQMIRGQVSCGAHAPDELAPLPPFPVNGHGNFVSQHAGPWIMGSTFERGVETLPVTPTDQALAHAANFHKLQTLLPACSPTLSPWFDPQDSHCQPTWGQIRCASRDRLPIVGPVRTSSHGLWAVCALGSRGLTLSVLCGEWLAAQLHAEPPALDAQLARHVSVVRL